MMINRPDTHKPVLLDTFCKAGGATKGYQEAGFYVVGVDTEPQPNYCGDEFYQAEALEFIDQNWRHVDAIHASPPCQKYTGMRNMTLSRFGSVKTDHPDLIKPTREALARTGLPYIIENVQNSPLETVVILCGASLGLRNVSRHRHFESNYLFFAPRCACRQEAYTIGIYGSKPDGRRVSYRQHRLCRVANSLEEAQGLLEIDWMTWDEIRNAIPPRYTKYLGDQLLNVLQANQIMKGKML
jgi:DNA (cytosine-5)-methyltransferase 1